MNVNLEIITGEGLKEITDKERIGSGGFGIVYKAKWRGQRVAIKELKASDFSKSALDDFQRECQMMAKLRCNHLVGLYAITKEPYGLMMECMDGGSLCERLDLQQGDIPWVQRYRWAKEVGKGIEFLHAAGVFHRDIKSENVLLTKKDQAKLGDLGLSKLAHTSKSTQAGSVGTYPWMAPELLQNVKYTVKSDMYSYGVLLWEIASRKEPFTEVEMKCLIPMQVLMGTLKLEVPEKTPKAFGDIIKSCCDVSPDKRPTITEVVSHLRQIIKVEKEKVVRQPIKVAGKPSKPTSGGPNQAKSGYVLNSTRPPSRGGYLGSIVPNQKTETTQAQKTEQARLEQAKAEEVVKTEQLRLEIAKEAAKSEQLQLELQKAKEATRAEQLKLELAKEKAKAELLKMEKNKANETAKADQARLEQVKVVVEKRAKTEQAMKEAIAQAERVKKEQRNPIEDFAFGGEKWKATFGDPGPVPPLPADIEQILSSPCPFWKGKKVQETHLLVFIPATIDGKPFTLKRLEQLIEHPKQGHATKYCSISDKIVKEYGDKPCGGSHWVLMTRDVIEGTRGKTFKKHQDLIKTLGKGLYQVPTLLEAAACILTEYNVSGNRLYSESPSTYTRCQEAIEGLQAVVGGFSSAGLDIFPRNFVDYYIVGVAFIRKV